MKPGEDQGGDGLELRNVKAKHSSKPSYIRFKNTTQRRVDVIWINYDGVKVKYKTLLPMEYFDVTSFVSHPWIFRDADNKMKLVCGKREIFDCPQPTYVKLKDGVRATRQVVNITLPLYSLRDYALRTVQKHIRQADDAYALAIPAHLQRELFERLRSQEM